MLFYILLELENDLGEVETSFVFTADFYYQIFIKETSYCFNLKVILQVAKTPSLSPFQIPNWKPHLSVRITL